MAKKPAVTVRASAGPAGRPPPSPTTWRARSSTRARATRRGPAPSATADAPGRSGPTTCSSEPATQPDWVNLNRVADPAGRRATAAAGQPDHRHERRPHAAAALLVPAARAEGRGGPHRRRPRHRRHRTGSSTATGPRARPAARSPTGHRMRSTSYVYPGPPITNAAGRGLPGPGFELALHLWDEPRRSSSRRQLPQLPDPLLARLGRSCPVRVHLSQPGGARHEPHPLHHLERLGPGEPNAERRNGVRLDANYYYWPPTWVPEPTGLLHRLGLPAGASPTLDGSLIDVYQAATQLTDESGHDVRPLRSRTLLDNATGPDRLLRRLTANMHTDNDDNSRRRRDHRGGAGPRRARRLGDADALPGLTAATRRRSRAWRFSRGSLSFSVGPGRRRDRAAGHAARQRPDRPPAAADPQRHGRCPITTQNDQGHRRTRPSPAGAGSYVATYPAPPATPGAAPQARRSGARRRRGSRWSRCSRGARRRRPSLA